MDDFDFVIQEGSEKDKEYILKKYPATGNVIRDRGVLIVALQCNEIIGFLWMYKREIPAPVYKKEWFINVIDVPDADCRCRGVGSGLVREAIHYAKEDNVYQVSAYCDIANVSSHLLWIKNGFSILPVCMADGSTPGSFVGFVL